MTRRHDSLIPLTHDHHHTLAQARRLHLAAGAAPHERVAASAEFIMLFDTDILAHFRDEEERIFPLVIDHDEAESALVRVMMEHLRIHAAVGVLRTEVANASPSTSSMEALADLIVDHVRFEEKVLFPMIELAAGSALSAVELSRERREDHGAVHLD
jgi:iron-sulfur cluster repair protein YtfE (RIC family)